jgi:hypothetical protein
MLASPFAIIPKIDWAVALPTLVEPVLEVTAKGAFTSVKRPPKTGELTDAQLQNKNAMATTAEKNNDFFM